MPAEKLIEYLEGQNVEYEVIEHEMAYTAQEAAAAAHIPGRQVAKAVMLFLDDTMVMAVLPASSRINLERLKRHVKAKHASFASEKEFKAHFPDCDVGALPPFGNLYDIKVYAASSLAEEVQIAVCGGTHTDLIRMKFADFKRLADPEILDFAYQPD
jgi:Ala-tRNA(Pro) deacylase